VKLKSKEESEAHFVLPAKGKSVFPLPSLTPPLIDLMACLPADTGCNQVCCTTLLYCQPVGQECQHHQNIFTAPLINIQYLLRNTIFEV